ncbi:MAG: hypothetical protein IKX88_04775, partial [Thermoguttaceae bacterium]|nr:hypothetical protein [Thermoguttaceae bacterium]
DKRGIVDDKLDDDEFDEFELGDDYEINEYEDEEEVDDQYEYVDEEDEEEDKSLTIHAPTGSCAERYAEEHEIRFKSTD